MCIHHKYFYLHVQVRKTVKRLLLNAPLLTSLKANQTSYRSSTISFRSLMSCLHRLNLLYNFVCYPIRSTGRKAQVVAQSVSASALGPRCQDRRRIEIRHTRTFIHQNRSPSSVRVLSLIMYKIYTQSSIAYGNMQQAYEGNEGDTQLDRCLD